MEQIERIQHMEKILNEGIKAIEELSEAIEKYKAIKSQLEELNDYYTSELWQKDFSDDEQGKLPRDLKRGILSEDAIYNLMTEQSDLIKEIKELTEI